MTNTPRYTVSAKNQDGDFEQHRFSIGGPYTTLAAAERTKEEAESQGYKAVTIHEVEDEESSDT